jgi:hypothetical protein
MRKLSIILAAVAAIGAWMPVRQDVRLPRLADSLKFAVIGDNGNGNHPLHSNAGRHGSNVDLRLTLEPLLIQNGADVVFSGHEHVYERIAPQHGITYFTVGSSGQLRKGDLTPGPSTAASFDQDQAFMIVEVSGDNL